MPAKNGNGKPVTAAELRAALDQLSVQLKTELKNELKDSEARMMEFMRDIETHLLSAFHDYHGQNDVKFQRLRTDVKNVSEYTESRLDSLDRRVTGIEKKLGLPPHGGAAI